MEDHSSKSAGGNRGNDTALNICPRQHLADINISSGMHIVVDSKHVNCGVESTLASVVQVPIVRQTAFDNSSLQALHANETHVNVESGAEERLQHQGQRVHHHHDHHHPSAHPTDAQHLAVPASPTTLQQHSYGNSHTVSSTISGPLSTSSSPSFNPYINLSINSNVNTTNNQNSNHTFSLPPELRKILHEVARTGRCSSLPWTASGISFNYFNSNPKRSSKRNRRNGLARKSRKHYHHTSTSAAFGGSVGNISGLSHSLYTKGLNADNMASTQHALVNVNSSNFDDSHITKSMGNASKNNLMLSSVSFQSKIEKKEKIEEGINVNFKVDQVPPSSTNHLHVSLANKESSTSSMQSIPNSHTDSCSIASQGSRRSVDLSVSISTSVEMKRRRCYRDNQSYASSCSESVSSAGGVSTTSIPSSSASMGPLCLSLPFRTLRGALRLAVALVLEYSYKNRGGYKLSPAEKRRFDVLQNAQNKLAKEKNSTTNHPSQTDIAFMERRMRLLKMLGGGKSGRSSSSARLISGMYSGNASDGGFTSDTSIDSLVKRRTGEDFANHTYGPPFTIQRVAEVLLMPERYYVQTHKLCNALEKLLLVTSPSISYGGNSNRDSSRQEQRERAALSEKNRTEEKEIAAMVDKKEREEIERLQIRKLQPSDGNDPIIQMNVSVETPERKIIDTHINQQGFPITNDSITATSTNLNSDQENRLTPNPLLSDGKILGDIDRDSDGPPVSVNMVDSSFQHAIVQSQRLSSGSDSFSPGSLSGAAVLQHGSALKESYPSPSLFSANQGLNQLMTSHQAVAQHHLQTHHGSVLDTTACLRAGPNVQMEIVIDQASGGSCPTVTSVQAGGVYLDQVDQGRSSASNSDIDSESDDISFDDSASDRSDGSDFDPGLSEPFTAARVMVLNRMQQQHRREQYLQDRALRQVVASSNYSPSDSEYQSGDSGSDSSSSDVAD